LAIREGAWDCPVCGRKGNRGPDKFCGGCGSPRGPEVKFYLPEDAPEVTEAEALKRAQAGPDWVCPYCGADNPSTNEFCSGCGAPRDGAKNREVVEHRLDAPPPPPVAAPLASAPQTDSRLKKGCGFAFLGLIALAALVFFLGRPKSTTLTVTGHHWLRTIAVEELRPVTEQAWEGDVPGGARVLGKSREVHHVDHIQIGSETRTRTVSEQVQTGTERVKVGTKDLGNTGAGVDITNGAHGNSVGGSSASMCNVISGNDLFGVGIYNGSTGNTVQNNRIGICAKGYALLNSKSAVSVSSASRMNVAYDARSSGDECGTFS